MIWNLLKSFLTAACLSLAALILLLSPINFGTFGFACFIVFLGSAIWIDFSKPISAQNLSNTQRAIVKAIIWGLIAILAVLYIHNLFSNEAHFNGKGFWGIVISLIEFLK